MGAGGTGLMTVAQLAGFSLPIIVAIPIALFFVALLFIGAVFWIKDKWFDKWWQSANKKQKRMTRVAICILVAILSVISAFIGRNLALYVPNAPDHNQQIEQQTVNNVTSYNQSGGVTAGTYIDQRNIQEPAERIITKQQESAVIAALKPSANVKPSIAMYCYCNNAETKKYLIRVANVMQNAGWRVELKGGTIDLRSEIIVQGIPEDASIADKIAAAFKNQGVKASSDTKKTLSGGLEIIVSMKE